MTYHCQEKIKLIRSEFEQIKTLFKVDLNDVKKNGDLTAKMQRLVDESDYRADTMPFSFAWDFSDGRTITMDICCGQNNAFDDCILWEDEEDIEVFDCGYDITESIEFEHEGNSYICEFEIVNDKED